MHRLYRKGGELGMEEENVLSLQSSELSVAWLGHQPSVADWIGSRSSRGALCVSDIRCGTPTGGRSPPAPLFLRTEQKPKHPTFAAVPS